MLAESHPTRAFPLLHIIWFQRGVIDIANIPLRDTSSWFFWLPQSLTVAHLHGADFVTVSCPRLRKLVCYAGQQVFVNMRQVFHCSKISPVSSKCGVAHLTLVDCPDLELLQISDCKFLQSVCVADSTKLKQLKVSWLRRRIFSVFDEIRLIIAASIRGILLLDR